MNPFKYPQTSTVLNSQYESLETVNSHNDFENMMST